MTSHSGDGDAVFIVLVALCATDANNKHPYQNTIIHTSNNGPACPGWIYTLGI
jgi:hypothetical protein